MENVAEETFYQSLCITQDNSNEDFQSGCFPADSKLIWYFFPLVSTLRIRVSGQRWGIYVYTLFLTRFAARVAISPDPKEPSNGIVFFVAGGVSVSLYARFWASLLLSHYLGKSSSLARQAQAQARWINRTTRANMHRRDEKLLQRGYKAVRLRTLKNRQKTI